MNLEEKAIIRELLIDDNLSFNENKYNVLKFRGFKPDVNFTRLNEVLQEDEHQGLATFRVLGFRLNDWNTETELLSISTIEELLLLFDKDTVSSHDVIRHNPYVGGEHYSWDWFTGRVHEIDECRTLTADLLDPFIARLVLAFIKIGLYTNFSCDGWHNSTRKVRVRYSFSEHYSVAWHDAIFRTAYEKGSLAKCIMRRNPKKYEYSAANTIEVYKWLNPAAQYLENNERSLIEAKERLINDVYNGLRIDSLDHVDLVNKMREYL